MKNKILWLTAILSVLICQNLFAAIAINEFLADPPNGLAGDTNLDGIRSSSDDEFVELYNLSDLAQNLSGWSLWDGTSLRHLFAPNTIVNGKDYLVVFGGGNLSNFTNPAVKASTGTLSLNNTSDQIFLKNTFEEVIDHVLFGAEGDKDQSLTRFPEGTGVLKLHSQASSSGLLFSPGKDVNGNKFVNKVQDQPAVPEPFSLLLVSLGILMPKFRRLL